MTKTVIVLFLFGTPKRESWNKSNSANCTLDISQIVTSCTFLLQHLHFHLFSVRTKPQRRRQRRRKEARDSPPLPLWRKKNGKSAALQGKSRSSTWPSSLLPAAEEEKLEEEEERRETKREEEAASGFWRPSLLSSLSLSLSQHPLPRMLLLW